MPASIAQLDLIQLLGHHAGRTVHQHQDVLALELDAAEVLAAAGSRKARTRSPAVSCTSPLQALRVSSRDRRSAFRLIDVRALRRTDGSHNASRPRAAWPLRR